jgi:hypothetical protein
MGAMMCCPENARVHDEHFENDDQVGLAGAMEKLQSERVRINKIL